MPPVELDCPPRVEESSSLEGEELEEMTELRLEIIAFCSARTCPCFFKVASMLPKLLWMLPKRELSCCRSCGLRDPVDEAAPPEWRIAPPEPDPAGDDPTE